MLFPVSARCHVTPFLTMGWFYLDKIASSKHSVKSHPTFSTAPWALIPQGAWPCTGVSRAQ